MFRCAVPVISVILFSSPQVYENVIRNVRLNLVLVNCCADLGGLQRRYIVYELGREAEDEDIDVASLTPELVNSTEVDSNGLKSLDAVVSWVLIAWPQVELTPCLPCCTDCQWPGKPGAAREAASRCTAVQGAGG